MNSRKNMNEKLEKLINQKTRLFLNFEQTDLTENREDFLRRKKAIDKCIPPILLISTARAASSGIANQISVFTNSPRVNVESQPIPIEHNIAKGLLQDMARGGCVSYVHSRASKENLRALSESGIKKLVLHLRDPRQSLLSNYWRMHGLGNWKDRRIYYNNIPLNYEQLSFSQQIDWHIENIYHYYWVKWIEEWLEIILQRTFPLTIKIMIYENFIQDPLRYFIELGDFYDLNWRSFSTRDLLKPNPDPPAKMQGTPDAWRTIFTTQQIDRIQELTPDKLLNKVGWKR